MLLLSYGYLKPQDDDDGDVVFPALENNAQLTNDHTHDGVNSAPLASQSQQILPGSWVAAAIGGGLYRQLVTMPVGLLYDTADMWFKRSTGEIVHPSIEKASATTYYIYTNDNSLTYVARYR